MNSARQPKKLTDWGRQLILPLRRWLPGRQWVVVADSSYATLRLLARCAGLRKPVTVVTRLRREAALYDPAPVLPSAQRDAHVAKGHLSRPWRRA